MKTVKLLLLLVCILGPISAHTQQKTTFALHSHNDYLQPVPFWDAFSAGCASIEVDVILQEGGLMVAHEKASIQAQRTFENLYLKPIQQGVELGLIPGFNFHLLVDIKTEAYSTLDLLVKQTQPYAAMLYSPENPSGLKLIISGGRPKATDYVKYPSWVFFDYQSRELTADLPWEKIGMVSLSFSRFSVWNGKGRIVESQRQQLQAFIDLVHSYDRPVRFWASPDGKTAWRAFQEMGIDYINTDRPAEARDYLSSLATNLYSLPNSQEVYLPTYQNDGVDTPVKQVFLLIGDGNGLAQISAGLFANGGQLSLAQIQTIGLVKTQAADDFTTDSAAGATAMATGQKANNRALGLNAAEDSIPNLPYFLSRKGFKTGLVTNDELTGATPAAFYAHHPERDAVQEIAGYLPNSALNLVIGGGGRSFNRDKLSQAGFTLVSDLQGLAEVKGARAAHFASERGVPSKEAGKGSFLSQAFLQASSYLGKAKTPFFLMLEAAKIDSGGHSNSPSTIVTELLDFDRVIGEVLRYADAHPGTLVLVTADHETGGVTLPQGNVAKGEVELGFHSDDHTGILVPIFAYGARSGAFRGLYSNTEIFNRILKVVNE
ncbi:MAG: alkaline phosphatase [Algoriphagus sp.]|nr:alkaline phosphatase [Algoriphagus sp.]